MLKTCFTVLQDDPVETPFQHPLKKMSQNSATMQRVVMNQSHLHRMPAQLILVMPATNAASERSFSAMRRLKTYLRSTMHQSRLNHLMLLQINKEKIDNLNINVVANEFVKGSEHRLQVFGKF